MFEDSSVLVVKAPLTELTDNFIDYQETGTSGVYRPENVEDVLGMGGNPFYNFYTKKGFRFKNQYLKNYQRDFENLTETETTD